MPYYPPQTQFPNPYAGYTAGSPSEYPPQATPLEPQPMAIPRSAPTVTAQPAITTQILTPAKQSPPAVSSAPASPDVSSLDPLNNEDVPATLEAPLRPLPAPMLPERLPSAKIAAIQAARKRK